jgi:hypothetical protein
LQLPNHQLPEAKHRLGSIFSISALLIYLGLSWTFFGTTADWHRFYLGSGQDPVSFVWFLHWWPFAIWHGLNPFITHYVWAPQGYDLAWATSVPAASLITLPITMAGGAVLSFNILSFLAPALAAWTTFLLVASLTEDRMAALPAGYVFGFSSYELGQLIGHLNLDLIFLVPVALWLCARRLRGRAGRAAFIASLALVLLFQIGFSLEIFATTCVMVARQERVSSSHPPRTGGHFCGSRARLQPPPVRPAFSPRPFCITFLPGRRIFSPESSRQSSTPPIC